MALNRAGADAVLHDLFWSQGVQEQLNNSNVILAQLKPNSFTASGRRIEIPMHTGRSRGIGSRAEQGTLPAADRQKHEVSYQSPKFHYGRLELTGPVIKSMRNSMGAYIQAIASEVTGIREDLQREMARQVMGTSDGVIAQCGTTSNAQVIVLAAGTSERQILQLFNDQGMTVDIGTVANPVAVVANVPVVDYDLANGTITIDNGGTGVTTSGSHFIFRAGNGGSGANQKELTGLQTLVNSGNAVQGVDGAAKSYWNAVVDGNGGSNRALTEALLTGTILKTQRRSGRTPDLLITTDGGLQAVQNVIAAQRRQTEVLDLKGGFTGIRWSTPGEGDAGSSSTVVTWSRDAIENTIYGLCMSEMHKLVWDDADDWDFMKEDGSMWSRKADTDAYEATLYNYFDVAITRRNCHFKLADITEI